MKIISSFISSFILLYFIRLDISFVVMPLGILYSSFKNSLRVLFSLSTDSNLNLFRFNLFSSNNVFSQVSFVDGFFFLLNIMIRLGGFII